MQDSSINNEEKQQIEQMKSISNLKDAWSIIFNKYFNAESALDIAEEELSNYDKFEALLPRLKNKIIEVNNHTKAQAIFLTYIWCKQHNLCNIHQKDLFDIYATVFDAYAKFVMFVRHEDDSLKNQNKIKLAQIMSIFQSYSQNDKKVSFETLTNYIEANSRTRAIIASNRLYNQRMKSPRYKQNAEEKKQRIDYNQQKNNPYNKKPPFHCGKMQYYKKPDQSDDEIKKLLEEQKKQYQEQLEEKRQLHFERKNHNDARRIELSESRKQQRHVIYQKLRTKKHDPAPYGIKYAIEHDNEQPKKPQGHFKCFLKRQKKWLNDRATKLQRIKQDIPSYCTFKPRINNKWKGYQH